MGSGIAQVTIQKAKSHVQLKDMKWEGMFLENNRLNHFKIRDADKILL
jgi:3-hydroxyacyl-CoA dehydrogenase